jgi:hypothetical protein
MCAFAVIVLQIEIHLFRQQYLAMERLPEVRFSFSGDGLYMCIISGFQFLLRQF